MTGGKQTPRGSAAVSLPATEPAYCAASRVRGQVMLCAPPRPRPSSVSVIVMTSMPGVVFACDRNTYIPTLSNLSVAYMVYWTGVQYLRLSRLR